MLSISQGDNIFEFAFQNVSRLIDTIRDNWRFYLRQIIPSTLYYSFDYASAAISVITVTSVIWLLLNNFIG